MRFNWNLNLKRTFSILLAFLILISSSYLVINKHVCQYMGQNYSIGFHPAKSCCDQTKGKCCHNEIKVLLLSTNFLCSEPVKPGLNDQVINSFQPVVNEYFNHDNNRYFLTHNLFSPPLKDFPLNVLYGTFLMWSGILFKTDGT